MKNNLIVYENRWIIEKIYEVSDRIHGQLVDPTLFEERSIKRVGEYLAQSESNRNNRRYIVRLINEVASAAIERNKNEHADTFTSLTTKNEKGETIEYTPEDVLANVESEVLAKEMATLLAQGNLRKKIILGNWITGNDNVSDIARLMAQTIGGSVETHRKYIHRFQKECRKVITF